jgi:hypothetical protein
MVRLSHISRACLFFKLTQALVEHHELFRELALPALTWNHTPFPIEAKLIHFEPQHLHFFKASLGFVKLFSLSSFLLRLEPSYHCSRCTPISILRAWRQPLSW